jgi:hypothetical protein
MSTSIHVSMNKAHAYSKINFDKKN